MLREVPSDEEDTALSSRSLLFLPPPLLLLWGGPTPYLVNLFSGKHLQLSQLLPCCTHLRVPIIRLPQFPDQLFIARPSLSDFENLHHKDQASFSFVAPTLGADSIDGMQSINAGCRNE